MTGEGTDKKYRSDVAETRHFKRKIQSVFFAAEGPDSSASGKVPLLQPTCRPNLSFWIHISVCPEFQADYACARQGWEVLR